MKTPSAGPYTVLTIYRARSEQKPGWYYVNLDFKQTEFESAQRAVREVRCAFVWVDVGLHPRLHAYVGVLLCMHTCVCTLCMCVCVYLLICNGFVGISSNACVCVYFSYTCMRVCVCMHACVSTSSYAYIVCVCVCVCVCVLGSRKPERNLHCERARTVLVYMNPNGKAKWWKESMRQCKR